VHHHDNGSISDKRSDESFTYCSEMKARSFIPHVEIHVILGGIVSMKSNPILKVRKGPAAQAIQIRLQA